MSMADGFEGDTVDADGNGIFRKPPPKPVDPVTIRGTKDSHVYAMDYGRRGLCIIFNHKEFESSQLSVRDGTDADESRLYQTFSNLDFDVQSYTDLTVREVQNVVDKAGKADLSKYSCFVCCILTHGDYGFLYAKDRKYPRKSIFAPFQGHMCPSLVGKPKIFLLQACQGNRYDPGVNVVCKASLDSGVNVVCEESLDSHFKIPTPADFLIVSSTAPGFVSWRTTTSGSWFIQALCEALEEHARDMDLLNILIAVNREVSLNYESNLPDDPERHLKKEVIHVEQTLTRTLKFYP